MKKITKILIVLAVLSLVGFTIVETEIAVTEEKKIEEALPAEMPAVSSSLVNYIDKGQMVASWYGPRFHGRLTANGEIYNQMAFTAAHKKLRFGTLLKVTNPVNNKSVIVRINDRGPYIHGRQLDLSKAAAASLGMVNKGVAKLKVEQISLKGINFPVIQLN